MKNYKVVFGCRYWSPDIGIGIRFPQYCCLDARGIEIWHWRPNSLVLNLSQYRAGPLCIEWNRGLFPVAGGASASAVTPQVFVTS